MTVIQDQVVKRFSELAAQASHIPVQGNESRHAEPQAFYAWAASALNVVQGAFGKDSPHYIRLEAEMSAISRNFVSERHLQACRGIFLGAKSDIDGGYLFNVESSFTGEIFGDFHSAVFGRQGIANEE